MVVLDTPRALYERKAGWTVTEDGGRNKESVVRWTLVAPTRDARNSSPPSRPPGSNGGEAGKAGQEYRPSPYDFRFGTCRRCDGEGCDWCGDWKQRQDIPENVRKPQSEADNDH